MATAPILNADSAQVTAVARVALVGNPNTGKSTLFNALAGMSVRTGNYPGVTIEKKLGRCTLPAGNTIDLIDLPGTYSLAPRSPDELVAVEVLTDDVDGERPIDAIVCVVNATLLQRNLFLVSQLLELGKPVVIALNMIDSANAQGISIDVEQLSQRLGVPVIPTAASKRRGIAELKAALAGVLSQQAGVLSQQPGVLSQQPGDQQDRVDTEIRQILPESFYGLRDSLRDALAKQHEKSVQVDVGPTTDSSELHSDSRASSQRSSKRATGSSASTDSDAPQGNDLLPTSSDQVIRAVESEETQAENTANSFPATDERSGEDDLPSDYVIERALLDQGGQAERRILSRLGPAAGPILQAYRDRLIEQLGDPIDMECNARYAWAKTQLAGVVANHGESSSRLTDRLDRVLTHGVGGVIGFVLVMFLIFQTIYSLAGWPMDQIDAATGLLSGGVVWLMPPGTLRSLITDGVIAGVGGVVIFVPQIALLFFFLALLEDCGYMARAAFLVDRIMTMFGLSGKSFLPMMSSFACAVPGVMATRVIENRRDRFATIMVAPLMSCSARLPVYLLLIAAFIPNTAVAGGWISLPALVLMSMYCVGVVVAIPVAWILKKTLLRGEVAPFVLELPEYKVPSWRVVFARVWEASKAFVIRAGTLIFAASIVIWFAGYWPGDHTRQYELQRELESLDEASPRYATVQSELFAVRAELLEGSLLGRIGHAIEPAVAPLGWDWRIGVGAVASFPAREVIIATLGTIYSLGGDAEEEGLIGALRASTRPDGTPVFSIPVALSIMVFFALCAQCVSTLLVIRRETNSWFWPGLSFTYMTVLAYLGALITYQIGIRIL